MLEPKPRGSVNSNSRGIRGGADRSARSSSVQSGSSGADNMYSRSSILGPGMPVTNSTQKQTVPSSSVNKDVLPNGSFGAMQPSSGFQNSWCGVPGQMSMADIVKMGRPQVRSSSKPVATTDRAYAIQSSSFSSVVSQNPNQSASTSPPTTFEQRFPVLQDPIPQVMNSKHASADNHETQESDWFQQDGTLSGSQLTVPETSRDISLPLASLESTTLVPDDVNSHNNSHVGENSSVIPSDRHLEILEGNNYFNDDLLHNSSTYQSQGNSYDDDDDDQAEASNVDVESAAANIQHLSLQTEDLVATKSTEDNPAVIIPDHLQHANADCGHLSFGSFGSGAFSGLLQPKVHKNSVEDMPTPDESPSVDQEDVRNQDHNVAVNSSTDGDIEARIDTNMENTDVPSVSQPDILTQGAVDVSSLQYNLPSVSDHVYLNTTQPSTMESPQVDAQVQHLPQYSSLLQANTLHNNLLGSNLSPLRDFDFSSLLATKYNPGVPTASLPAISMQETLKPGGFSNTQSTQNLPSTSILSGPPLPQQLSVHPYSQPTLPLGPFSNLVGYPYLPQNYYLPSAAFQQPYSSNGPFHQSAATNAVPGVNMKYSVPQYKSSLPATSPPQPSSVVSGFGGFGSSTSIPGNFGLNQNVPSAATSMGFDEALSAQFKDNSHYIALQQSDNSAMWLQGAAGSRAVSAVPPGNFYGFQGQNQPGGFRQGQQPSQYGGLGYPSFYQSQAGLPQEHPQNLPEGTLNSSQTAPSQPSHQLWQHIY
uniref:GBF-interacting protein 1 N-terminal domain-containing protein n=2 Tax=Oryza brachyantha TaxID=4533 RepID=J3L2M3_ORYBR